MRVAIQFYGFMRHYETTFPLWKRLIDKYNVDVFIHTWDTEEYKDYSDIIDFDSSGQLPNPKPLDIDRVTSLFSPKGFVADKYTDYHNKFVEKVSWMESFRKEYLANNPERTEMAYCRFTSYASMYYKWARVSQLKQKYEIDNDFIYDYVVHARVDFALTDLFIFDNITQIITPPWPNTTETQPWVNYASGLNDYWAYGPSKAMDAYCSVYYNMEKVRILCINNTDLGEKESVNAHIIPVANLAISGLYQFYRHNNQHGNILR